MIILPVEYLLWAINRDTYVEAIVLTDLSAYGWTGKLATKAINPATGQPDYPPVMIPGNGVQLDELGQIVPKAGVQGWQAGWHVNCRIYESALFDALKAYEPTLPIVQPEYGIPLASQDANGMKWLHLYQADGVTPTIATRRRIWA